MATAADKSFQLQLQMRRNTEEMSSFLKDMSEWSKDVKKQDESLLRTTEKPAATLPPIRSQPKPRKKKNNTVKIEDNSDKGPVDHGTDKKGVKLRAYDYRAWDKFDVDAALKEVDGEAVQRGEGDGHSVSGDEGSTDDEEMTRMEEERKQMQAVYHKERGNDFFKQGKWEDAVECYTKGLQQDSLNAVLFANRAMALLKLQKYAAAIVDCDCSLELDDTYTKAYLRRATAHLKLENKKEALADFNKVLEFEPENKLSLSAVKKLEVELAPPDDYKPRKPGDITNMKRTLPPSDKPMVRIHIYDISPDDYDMKPKKKGGYENVKDKKDDEVKDTKAGDDKKSKSTKKQECTIEFQNLPCRIPTSSLQFQTDVRKLKNYPEKLFEYIRNIDPDLYPKLFQESLEADHLFLILDILEKFYIPRNLSVFNELYYLTKVKRFAMAIMFKTDAQKLTAGMLIEYEAKNCDNKAGIIELIKAYGVLSYLS